MPSIFFFLDYFVFNLYLGFLILVLHLDLVERYVIGACEFVHVRVCALKSNLLACYK